METTSAPAPRPRIRLLALDVDGTVTNSRHEITAATCRGCSQCSMWPEPGNRALVQSAAAASKASPS